MSRKNSPELDGLIENFTRQARALLADEALFHTLVEKNADGLVVVDEGGEILYANPAAETLFLAEPGGLAGKRFGHPVLEGEITEIDLAHPKRRKATAEMQSARVEWEGRPAHLVSVRAVGERRKLKESLAKNSERLRALVNASPLAIVAVDLNQRVTLWNQAAARTFGWDEHEALGQLPPDTRGDGEGSLGDVCERAIQGEEFAGTPLVGQRRKDGETLDLKIWAAPLRDGRGLAGGAMIIAVDVTEKRRYMAHIRRLTGFDPLTGLVNRSQFRERVSQAFSRAGQTGQAPFAVLQLGLDRFKNINHSLGHSEGDLLLQDIARRLAAVLYDTDILARTDGDEFSVLLRDVRHADDGIRAADKLLDSIAQPFFLNGKELFVSASIGIALYPHDGGDAETLLRNADAAMSRAKEQGGNTRCFYTEDMNHRAQEQLALENSLRLALERNEFRLYYQPQVDLRCGRAVGVEALIRWFHPEMGLVPPDRFIPVAEKTGLIVPIGEWVLRTACAQAKTWRQAGLPDLRMAVNLSARQFQHPGLAQAVADALEESGLPPKLLELELTESVLMHNADDVVATMAALKRTGARLAVDDFGTGYSSLSYLARLPVDTLKIDRSFVRTIGQGPDDGAIAAAVAGLARSLGLHMVAEGVETEAQLRFLRAHHCDEIQGYLVSPPVPAAECAALLEAQPLVEPAAAVWKKRPRDKTPEVRLAD